MNVARFGRKECAQGETPVVAEDIDSTKVIDSVRHDSRRGSWVGYVQRSRYLDFWTRRPTP